MQYILIIIAMLFSTQSAQAVVKLPVSLILNQEAFELLPYEANSNGVPYKSGVAYWRKNGTVIEIVSHCTETPGTYFGNLAVGDELQISFSDNSTQTIMVYEVVSFTYESQSNPLANDFIHPNGTHYNMQELLEYSMLRDGYLLRSSRCSQGFAVGQYFIFAHVTPIK